MKVRKKIALIIDSISAVLQAFFFAIIPIIFCNVIAQWISYTILVIVSVIFYVWLRNALIDRVVFDGGVDTQYMQMHNIADRFHNSIVPMVQCTLQYKIPTDSFEQYCLYLKWSEVSTLVVNSFPCDKLNRIITDKQTIYTKNKLYKNEIQHVVNALTVCYKNNNKFTSIIGSFLCKTLASDTEDLNRKLLLIVDTLNNM